MTDVHAPSGHDDRTLSCCISIKKSRAAPGGVGHATSLMAVGVGYVPLFKAGAMCRKCRGVRVCVQFEMRARWCGTAIRSGGFMLASNRVMDHDLWVMCNHHAHRMKKCNAIIIFAAACLTCNRLSLTRAAAYRQPRPSACPTVALACWGLSSH